jgi:hypothetical protein
MNASAGINTFVTLRSPDSIEIQRKYISVMVTTVCHHSQKHRYRMSLPPNELLQLTQAHAAPAAPTPPTPRLRRGTQALDGSIPILTVYITAELHAYLYCILRTPVLGSADRVSCIPYPGGGQPGDAGRVAGPEHSKKPVLFIMKNTGLASDSRCRIKTIDNGCVSSPHTGCTAHCAYRAGVRAQRWRRGGLR